MAAVGVQSLRSLAGGWRESQPPGTEDPHLVPRQKSASAQLSNDRDGRNEHQNWR